MNLQGIAEAYSQVHEKKDSSYLETDMKKRQENNEKARKDMEKVKGQKNPHFEEAGVDEKKKNIRGNDSAEQKARLEKKRGMKLDDHPQFKKEEVSGIAAAYQAVYDEEDEVEAVDEGLTGARADRARQMQDSDTKSKGGKRTDADRDTAFRLGTGTGPGRVSDRPIKSQSDQGKGNAAKRRMKEELEGNPVYEATKADIKEFVGAMLGNAATSALANPVGAGLAAGTVGAVTGGKKKVKKSLATGAGAAAGAALGGLPGAVIGGIAGNALS